MKAPFVVTDMTQQEVEDIAEHAVIRTFPRHAIIINEGDDSDSVYFIVSGLVKVFLADNDGNEVIMATSSKRANILVRWRWSPVSVPPPSWPSSRSAWPWCACRNSAAS